MTAALSPRRSNWRWPLITGLLVVTFLAIVIGANIHLVWAAVSSQPECVPHAKAAGGTTFRAAKSGC